MNAIRLRAILAELIDENPFAIRAVLRILGVEFTNAVPTLMVTCEERPRLLVNLDFVGQNCRTDAEVKALLCHEFLHVLLRHTEDRKPYSRARHLALDAVINAIIHREHGSAYSGMMSRYYADSPGLAKLLRPMNERESAHYEDGCRQCITWPTWVNAWVALYAGTLLADDIEALAEEIGSAKSHAGPDDASGALGPFTLHASDADLNRMLGNHDDPSGPLPEALSDALNRAMREMNGSGIWRSPKVHGVGANVYSAIVSARNEPLERWQRRTLAVLRQHLLPDPRSRAQRDQPHAYRIPVLSPRDRRAFLRAQWSPFLPEALWEGSAPKREGSAHVYLDVSGSMNAEMPLVIALLARVSKWIRRPFWAFSDVVAPAVIERSQLKAQTTGGTSMRCVLEHVARTRPTAAIVVTDGYIEALDRTAVRVALAGTRLTALVTRDGNPAQLKRAGIPYTQLDKVPA
jgi:hypothetical protein